MPNDYSIYINDMCCDRRVLPTQSYKPLFSYMNDMNQKVKSIGISKLIIQLLS